MKTASAASGAKRPRLNRQEQREVRTRELLDAAEAMFLKKGYEDVTIDDVAEYAGYSRMPVYTLFGDKQTLFFELWQRITAGLTHKLFGAFTPGSPLRRNLRALAEAIANDLVAERPRDGEKLFFVVQTIALSRPDIAEKLEQLARKVVKDVAGYLAQGGLAAGESLRSEPESVAAHLVAHINGMATVQFQTHGRYIKARDLAPIFEAIVFKE